MARGGKRAGAGRKAGSANVKTRLIADAAAANGITPLEIMLENMLWHRDRALEAEELAKTPGLPTDATTALRLEASGARRAAQGCASDAASYVHPALKAVEHRGDGGGPVKLIVEWAKSE